jgi:competence protein ComEC
MPAAAGASSPQPYEMAALSRPLTLGVLCFVSGIALALRLGGEFRPGLVPLLLLTAVLLGLWSLVGAGPGTRPLYPLVFLLLGAGLGLRSHHELRTDCRRALGDGAKVRAEGVLEASHLGANAEGRVPLLPLRLRALSVGDRWVDGCSGVVRVRLPASATELTAGTALVLHGEWWRVPAPPVPSGWPRDPRAAGWVRVDSVHIEQAKERVGTSLLTLRGRSETALRALVPEHPELVEALVLGRRERLDPRLREKFARAGLSHLLAISGMHVGILAGVLLMVGRMARLTRAAATWVTIVLIGTYLLFIGAPPSAVRAGTMISLALWASRMQRPFEPLGLIVAAAFGILVFRPATLLEPGFQLSFGGVIGILVARRIVLGRLPGSLRSVRGGEWLAESMVVSAAAFLATAPIVAWHFGLLAPIAIVAKLVAVPLLGLALVGILLGAAITPVLPPVGSLFATAASTMLDLIGRVADVAAAIPFGHGWVTRPQAVTWICAVAIALAASRAGRSLRAPIRVITSAGALLAALLLVPALSARIGPAAEALEIHFLDVGQGDAIAIRTPVGRWLLIDTGPADDRFDAGERRILPFLRAHGVQRLELMILTHPHRDHIGGAPAILRGVVVGTVVEPGYAYASPLYLEILRTVERSRTAWRAARTGDSIELDGVSLDLLWPDEAGIETATDANEISVVIRLRFGPFAALFTGDAYDTTEWELVRRHGSGLRSQVLKAGHHGSYTSTSPALLDAVTPELVVISAGHRNRFGHPSPEVVRELRRRGLRTARTDLDGTVTVRVDTSRVPIWRIEEIR